jgi:hypothetical protein
LVSICVRLAEVIVEAVGGLAVEAGPESGLADRGAAGEGHGLVVVGGAAHHVAVRFDVTHGRRLTEAGPDARGGLGVGLGDGFDGGVAPEVQDAGDAAFLLLQEERESGAEAPDAMVVAAGGAVEAVEEGRQVEAYTGRP